MVTLSEHEAKLPAELVRRVDAALQRAAEGTMSRLLPANYANIALMRVSLLDFCAERFIRSDWRAEADRFAEETWKEFARHDAFDEFNSPTYYSVDIAALALWVQYGSTGAIREFGRKMEEGLWRDIGLFYHAGLKNMCGPFDRSYGMELASYDNGLAAWIAFILGQTASPETEEAIIAFIAGTRVPAEVVEELRTFSGCRQIERRIGTAPDRVVTAWLGESLMLGGQDARFAKVYWSQYHPATAHWRTPHGGIGTLRVIPTLPIDARASENELRISCYLWPGTGTRLIQFRFELTGVPALSESLGFSVWKIPGWTVHVTTNVTVALSEVFEAGLQITYEAVNLDSGTLVEFLLRFDRVDS